MPIDLDDNPLTRVVDQARRECPNLYRAFQQDLHAFQDSHTPHNAGNVLYMAIAIVCKEQGLTPRQAVEGMQRRIEELDERVKATGTLLRQPAAVTGGEGEEE